MTDAGKRAMTGLDIRLTNIRADAGAGFGVFDTLHDVDDPALLADHLRDASATFYGAAGRAFVAKLVATRANDPDGFYERLKAWRLQFISDHLPAGSDGQVRSVGGRFGVVAAAGELATEWNILPWETGEATNAAMTCFQAWLAERGGIGAGEDHVAIRQVRQFFEAHGTSRFTEIRAGVAYQPAAWQRGLGLTRLTTDHRTSDAQSLRLAHAMARAMDVFSSCRKRGKARSAKESMARWQQRHWRTGWLKRDDKSLTCK